MGHLNSPPPPPTCEQHCEEISSKIILSRTEVELETLILLKSDKKWSDDLPTFDNNRIYGPRYWRPVLIVALQNAHWEEIPSNFVIECMIDYWAWLMGQNSVADYL